MHALIVLRRHTSIQSQKFISCSTKLLSRFSSPSTSSYRGRIRLFMLSPSKMRSFMKKLLGRLVSVSAIKAAPDITEVEYRENQIPGMFCIDTCTIIEGRQYFHYYQLLYLAFSRLSRQCFVHWYHYKAIAQKVRK